MKGDAISGKRRFDDVNHGPCPQGSQQIRRAQRSRYALSVGVPGKDGARGAGLGLHIPRFAVCSPNGDM